MNAPTTQREEIRQLLAASSEPLTRPEIFAQSKLLVDELALSTVLSQLVNKGLISRVGERARDKGAPLALYTSGAGGNPITPKGAGRARRKGKKPSKQRRASGSKTPRSAPTARRKAPAKTGKPKRKYTRRAGTQKGGKSIEKVSRKTASAIAPERFRCGIFNDGTLAINAEDGQITLSEQETRAMFSYLDRVLGNAAA